MREGRKAGNGLQKDQEAQGRNCESATAIYHFGRRWEAGKASQDRQGY